MDDVIHLEPSEMTEPLTQPAIDVETIDEAANAASLARRAQAMLMAKAEPESESSVALGSTAGTGGPTPRATAQSPMKRPVRCLLCCGFKRTG